MKESRRETEIKLRFPSPAAALERIRSLGATAVHDREFEDNAVYDLPSEPLRASGRLLRLRRIGERSVLTLKEKVPGNHRHKVRLESETGLDRADEMERILEGLGFSPVYRYQKYRTLFLLDGVEVCLDETPIGCFVEIEGEPDGVDRVALRLGSSPDRYILGTYRQLHEEDAAARGIPIGDLLFEK